MRISRYMRLVLFIGVFFLVQQGTGYCWGNSEKIEALENKVAELKATGYSQTQEIDTLKEQKALLQEEKDELNERIATLENRLASKEQEVLSCQDKLAIETQRGSGIKVIFFNGDIIYEISSDAFVDYKAGLRYRTLIDPNFFKQLQTFEQGQGGDFEVLAVLKEVDLSNDRLIDRNEALRFRKASEERFAKSEM